MKCPKCGGSKIYTEGVEIYCMTMTHTGRKCFYHFSGVERIAYRAWQRKYKIKDRTPDNMELTEEDQTNAKKQHRARSRQLCLGTAKKLTNCYEIAATTGKRRQWHDRKYYQSHKPEKKQKSKEQHEKNKEARKKYMRNYYINVIKKSNNVDC